MDNYSFILTPNLNAGVKRLMEDNGEKLFLDRD